MPSPTSTRWLQRPLARADALARLLQACAHHPVLGSTLALAGGTALHLLQPQPPRLPGELSFHYVAAIDRDRMVLDRQRIQRGFREVARELGHDLRVASSDHAAMRWQLTSPIAGASHAAGSDEREVVATAADAPLALDVDVNFVLRAPLLEPRMGRGSFLERVPLDDIPVLARVDVAAGVLVGALDRRRTRDVFDARSVLVEPVDDDLRVAFFARLAGVREDWAELLGRPVRPHAIDFARDLVPLLPVETRPRNADAWNLALCAEVDELLAPLRALSEGERAFLTAVSDDGEVRPDLLGLAAGDPRSTSIARSPALAWKARHVRDHGDVDPVV